MNHDCPGIETETAWEVELRGYLPRTAVQIGNEENTKGDIVAEHTFVSSMLSLSLSSSNGQRSQNTRCA